MAPYTVSPNNWSQEVKHVIDPDVEKGKNSVRYQVTYGQGDPAVGCGKNFTTAYSCGSVQKTASLDPEAFSKYVTYDCSQEAAYVFRESCDAGGQWEHNEHRRGRDGPMAERPRRGHKRCCGDGCV